MKPNKPLSDQEKSCSNPKCTCNPCNCTDCTCEGDACKGKSCCSHDCHCCHSYARLDGWAWVRIGIVIALIVGAYVWGVCAGIEKNDRNTLKYGPEYMPRNSMMHNERSFSRMPSNPQVSRPSDIPDMDMRHMNRGMLAGQTGATLEKAFLVEMISHHQGAIDMAKYLTGSIHPELRTLGEQITKTQSAEIQQMQQWLVSWGYVSTGSLTNTGKSFPNMMR